MRTTRVADGVTLEHVQKFLMTHFELRLDQVGPSARLAEDLELDSLDAVDLVVRLEQETGLEISEDELKGMETVQDIYEVLRRKFDGGLNHE